ncbi:MAG: 50S ribosomal protein L11 methyltransferase [Dehalococcoidia bacterium]|nr:50S ribosomal protein L11 methyltransferase [Dehalococcoidia bacterium]
MDWVQVRATVPPEFVEPLVELVRRYATGSVVLETAGGYNPDEGETPPPSAPVTVTAYFPNNRRASWRKARLEAGVQLLSMIRPLPPFESKVLHSGEWEESWKAHFPVLRLGRIVLAPPWLDPTVRTDDVLVRLDPGLAFGTGHHPTTRRCILALGQYVRPGMRVLDVGCGSGILSIVAAKLGAAHVEALDTDLQAVQATRRNARANAVARSIRVRKGTLPQPHLGAFDLVVANISATALIALAPHFPGALGVGGTFIGSGLLAQYRDKTVPALEAAGLVLAEEFQDDDWATLVFVARPATPAKNAG